MDAQAARSRGVGVASERGVDPARRIIGRKRHALTDEKGRLLVAGVSIADLHDNHGGIVLSRASRGLFPLLAHCFADRAYRGERVGTVKTIVVEIVEQEAGQKGFAVQRRQWSIECTSSPCRRRAPEYEAPPSSERAFFVLTAAMILVNRHARASRNRA